MSEHRLFVIGMQDQVDVSLRAWFDSDFNQRRPRSIVSADMPRSKQTSADFSYSSLTCTHFCILLRVHNFHFIV